MNEKNDMTFQEAVQGFLAGDFTRLALLFEAPSDGSPCPVIKWFEDGLFESEPSALEEAFTCASFNNCIDVVEYFLAKGINPSGGIMTGLNAFHWAANRGQLEMVEILIHNNAPLETKNSYGGTVLDCTVWSAIYEPKANHIPIIEALLKAGADVDAVGYPTGDERIDEVFRRYGVPE